MAQWERKLVAERYERPLVLQLCRLLRGFTHPQAYFRPKEIDADEFSIDDFAREINSMIM